MTTINLLFQNIFCTRLIFIKFKHPVDLPIIDLKIANFLKFFQQICNTLGNTLKDNCNIVKSRKNNVRNDLKMISTDIVLILI